MEKLLWIDLEMTGLDVEKEVIIEVACIVTDMDFNHLDKYHAVVKQPQKLIDSMDEWNTKHHGASGLTKEIPNGMEPSIVEDELMAFVRRHWPSPDDKPVIAGNSIAQDRLFITKYWPRFNAVIHYRMLDVTSWKIMMKEKFKVGHKKGNAHRAQQDVEESIREMKNYINFVADAVTAQKAAK